MSNLRKYGSYSIEAAEADAARAKEMGGGGTYLKLEVGDNWFRFLPPPIGKESPFLIGAKHFLEGIEPGKKVVFWCPRKMLGKPCIACVRAEQLAGSISPLDKQRAKDVAANFTALIWAIGGRGAPHDPEQNLGILELNWSTHKGLSALLPTAKVQKGKIDWTNPYEDGYDINIRKAKKAGSDNHEYTVAPDLKPSPLALSEEVLDAIMARATDLMARVDCTIPEKVLELWGDSPVGTPRVVRPSPAAGGVPRAGAGVVRPRADDIVVPAEKPQTAQEKAAADALGKDGEAFDMDFSR